jgi:hypothetical protein
MRSKAAPALSASVVVIVAALTTAASGVAHAARPFISRDLVLRRGDVALDLGFGIGHALSPLGEPESGLGMNLELSIGIARDAEIGVRTGFRLTDAGQRTQADRYGRTFDTETYDLGFERVANPEIHVRWGIAHGPSAELGFELRAIMPIEQGTHFGMVLGLPVALRTGILRLDTGVYLPIIFNHDTLMIVSVPAHLWIQASPTLWLGPLFGLRFFHQGGRSWNEFPLGFGLGTMLSSALDLRAWFLFPNVDNNDNYGGGLAFQIRFE